MQQGRLRNRAADASIHSCSRFMLLRLLSVLFYWKRYQIAKHLMCKNTATFRDAALLRWSRAESPEQ